LRDSRRSSVARWAREGLAVRSWSRRRRPTSEWTGARALILVFSFFIPCSWPSNTARDSVSKPRVGEGRAGCGCVEAWHQTSNSGHWIELECFLRPWFQWR
jgi:hypothetical protein